MSAWQQHHSEIQRFIERVEQRFGVSRDVLASSERGKQIALARHTFWYALRQNLKLSYPDIGLALEGKKFDHGTIILALRRFTKRLEDDARLADDVAFVLDVHENAVVRILRVLVDVPEAHRLDVLATVCDAYVRTGGLDDGRLAAALKA